MEVKWIHPETEEVLGIARKQGAIFEIGEDIAKQLIVQGKARIHSTVKASTKASEPKKGNGRQ